MNVPEFRNLVPGDRLTNKQGHEATVMYRKEDYICIRDRRDDTDFIYEIGCHEWSLASEEEVELIEPQRVENVEARESQSSTEGS